MATKHYLIKTDLNKMFSCSSEWQLQAGHVIKDVGTNMFIAMSVSDAVNNRFQQLNHFESKLVRLLIEENATEIQLC